MLPFKYNPRDNQLYVINSGSFQINIKGSLNIYKTHSEIFNSFLKNVFSNYDGYTSKSMMNYLIITAPEYQSGLAPFVALKTAAGLMFRFLPRRQPEQRQLQSKILSLNGITIPNCGPNFYCWSAMWIKSPIGRAGLR